MAPHALVAHELQEPQERIKSKRFLASENSDEDGGESFALKAGGGGERDGRGSSSGGSLARSGSAASDATATAAAAVAAPPSPSPCPKAASSTPTTTASASFVQPPLLEPPLSPQELSGKRLVVCVTGVTGFVAGHVVHRLLAAGHTVRGTCRNPSDARATGHLWKLSGAAERLSLFEADLLAPAGAFDAAVEGCDAVVHTASPYVVQDYAPGEEDARIVDPAVKGTESVLGSATRHARTVRRVVLTASTASVFTDPTALLAVGGGGKREEEEERAAVSSSSSSFLRRRSGASPPLATELHWNDGADKARLPYFYAKTKAERRAYEIEAAQPSGAPHRWALASINPPAVLGPPLSARADGESVSQMRDLLSGRIWPFTPYIGVGAADVRDVAQCHVLAAVLPEAPRGRHLVASCSSGFALHDAARVLRGLYPERRVPFFAMRLRCVALPFCPMLGLPTAMARAMWAKPANFSTARAAAALGKGCGGGGKGEGGAAGLAGSAAAAEGEAALTAEATAIPYLPFDKTVRDMAEAMIAHGMVQDETPVVFFLVAKIVAALLLVALVLAGAAALFAARAGVPLA